jgi:hypothetical protein
MPVTVTAFEDKKYIIDGAEFKLKKPTLGIKRQATFFASGLHARMQELLVIVKKSEKDAKKANEKDSEAIRGVYESVDYLQKKFDEVFVKAEEFFGIVLIPIKAGDESKLVAENLDEKIIKEVLDDFFQLARS